ncbi:MAG: 2-phosphosulfolactate phosphatase [Mycobacterium sp.]
MFSQEGYQLRLEWGGEGVSALGPQCAVLVVVDVLSFTTSVDLVVAAGGRVRPVRWTAHSSTLRPSSLVNVPEGTLVEITSPNGATLCDLASGTGATVLAGCLRNAAAVAKAALARADGGPIGLIPAGERWGEGHTGPLRPSVEDLLGAGAVAAELVPLLKASPEARLAADAYRNADIARVLTECASGRELIAAGDGSDIDLALRIGVSGVAPVLVDGVLRA